MASRKRAPRISPAFALLVLLQLCRSLQANPQTGFDLDVGGEGKGNGTFFELKDITFDSKNVLYVLDGAYWNRKTQQQDGNLLIQKFDEKGKFISQFSIECKELGKKNDPMRIAVDSQGNVYLTQPLAGQVQRYSPDGKLLGSVAVPNAYALAIEKVTGGERVVVAPNVFKGREHPPVDEFAVIDASSGALASPLKLSEPIGGCSYMAADSSGNLYAQCEPNRIVKLDSTGKVLKVVGGGTKLNLQDGSELICSVAVDPQGRVYAWTPGNPAQFARFDADLAHVSMRKGRFSFADPWNTSPNFPIAIDGNGRIWTASAGRIQPDNPNRARYHKRPTLIRVDTGFYSIPAATIVSSTKLLGINPTVETKLPYNVTCDLKPIDVDFVLQAGNRQISSLDVSYVVYDIDRNPAGTGSFSMELQNGVEARKTITFTPPQWGWYTAEFTLKSAGELVMAVAGQIGVTPKYPGMPTLAAGDSKGGMVDPVKQAFVGLQFFRISPSAQNIEKIAPDIDAALKQGLNIIALLGSEKECTPEFVTQVVNRYKDKIKNWEVMNEPNFSMSPQKYVELVKVIYPLIKQLQPDSRVLGPDVCGIQLPWYEAFYEAGGGKFVDVLSIHDYEGHEDIDAMHWRRKIGDLRQLMAGYGDEKKEIWQTERAVSSVRGHLANGPLQAVRILLHEDLLESLGIPDEHDQHYYLNSAGYASVPSYIWCEIGPYPAALALRTRHAMVQGRHFDGALDFGAVGNKVFLALKYSGADGTTLSFRNLGSIDTPLELGISGGDTVEVIDAFGNSQSIAAKGGHLLLTTRSMPQYLRLSPGQQVSVPDMNFGRNLAPLATFTYSARSENNDALNNGVYESMQFGYPDHDKFFKGDFNASPQTLEMTFAQPRTIDKLLVYGISADNNGCALLDYDVQYLKGAEWVTIQEVRANVPQSTLARTPLSDVDQWYLNQKLYFNRFTPVTTTKLRLLVRKCSWGLYPDEFARDIAHNTMAAKLMLREIEAYGPVQSIEVEASTESKTLPETFEKQKVTIAVQNRSPAPVKGTVKITVPDGWSAEPASLVLDSLAAGQSKSMELELKAPSNLTAGRIPIDVVLADGDQSLDYDRLTLDVPAQVSIATKVIRKTAEGASIDLTVSNRTKHELKGVVTLDATPVNSSAAKTIHAEAPLEALASGKGATVVLNTGELDTSVTAWNMVYSFACDRVVTRETETVFQSRPWLVLGPFPNEGGTAGFEAVYEPEEHLDTTAAYVLPNGTTAKWTPISNDHINLVNLGSRLKPTTDDCAYAAILVKSPNARQAIVSCGADSGLKVWVNGKQVLSKAMSHAVPDNDRAPVELVSGWNVVLLKVIVGSGNTWGYQFDLLTPDGAPMTDLEYTSKKDQ